MRPRTRPRRWSGCTTRRTEGRRGRRGRRRARDGRRAGPGAPRGSGVDRLPEWSRRHSPPQRFQPCIEPKGATHACIRCTLRRRFRWVLPEVASNGPSRSTLTDGTRPNVASVYSMQCDSNRSLRLVGSATVRSSDATARSPDAGPLVSHRSDSPTPRRCVPLMQPLRVGRQPLVSHRSDSPTPRRCVPLMQPLAAGRRPVGQS
jgi:hypothetical protein